MIDIEDLLGMQKALMEKVPHAIPVNIVDQMTAGLGIMEEAHEYLNAIGRKPWRPRALSEEARLEELADIFFYYLELVLLSGFTWEQVVERYKSKHVENLERYEKGSKGDFSWDDRAGKGEL